jgi:hypothetical protein
VLATTRVQELAVTQERRPPDGDKIATEVEREMEQRLYRLRHAILAPAEYHIYLHPDDFSHVKDVAPLIELDVQQCLNAAVKRLNGRSSVLGFVLPKRPPVEIPRGGWAIHIKPALNGEVGPGELAIHSRLSVPQAPKFGSGAGTVRIVQTVVSATERRTLERDEPHTAASSGPPVATGAAATAARLIYSDDSGEHQFAITKELIKIGRGGAAHWVDVSVVSGSTISREHCRIRRDAAGRFFLQDVSSWGTFLNGQRLPKFEGSGTAGARERELTDGASIRLADLVTLQFRIG